MPAAPSTSLRLTIPSDTTYLHLVTNLARNAALAAGFAPRDADKIGLATDEAVTNVIEHAYAGQSDRSIEVAVELSDALFEVQIIHDGVPLDEARLRSFDAKEHLRSRRRGGLGVELMRRLMDGVQYRTTADRRNACCLTMRRAPEPRGAGDAGA